MEGQTRQLDNPVADRVERGGLDVDNQAEASTVARSSSA